MSTLRVRDDHREAQHSLLVARCSLLNHRSNVPLRRVGREVYRARDTRLDRTVAIKVLLSGLAVSDEIRARFEREARAISALSNPHICALYDVGRANDAEYLVMEYLEGETLADRIARGPLPLTQVLRYEAQIADALQHAHRAGVMHRDLKPGNVMLTNAGVKLLDFGLAKLASQQRVFSEDSAPATIVKPITAEGTVVGTMIYMSPEQLEGRNVDHRTDIFSLGAILYEMATGQRPFGGSSQLSIKELFRAPAGALRHDVSPDGQSFLFIEGARGARDALFHMILGWQ